MTALFVVIFINQWKKDKQHISALLGLGLSVLSLVIFGKEDFLMQMNNDLRKYLDEHHYQYEYYENDGGHIWRNWRIYLTMFAQMIFK